MPVYNYSARDPDGSLIRGFEEASNEYVLLSILHKRGLVVTKVANADSQSSHKKEKRKHKKITGEDLYFFLSQTAVLLDAGIPLLRAIEVISDQIQSQNLIKVLDQIRGQIKEGKTLREAMIKFPKVFPQFWAYLIQAGEASGNMVLVLEQLAKYLQSSQNLKKKVVSALVYPSVLVTVSIGAILIFLIKIIPVFEKMFQGFNAKLPPMTAAVIAASNMVKHNIVYVVVFGTIAIYFLKSYIATANGRAMKDRLLINLPIFGAPIRDVIHARITMIFATLMKSGLSLMKSMEITGHAAGNAVFQAALERAALNVQQGKGLSNSLMTEPIFSPMMTHLMKIGEESGKLPEMTTRAASYYEERVEVFVSRLGVLIEPIILVFVGAVVGVLVISMFLPMINMGKAIR